MGEQQQAHETLRGGLGDHDDCSSSSSSNSGQFLRVMIESITKKTFGDLIHLAEAAEAEASESTKQLATRESPGVDTVDTTMQNLAKITSSLTTRGAINTCNEDVDYLMGQIPTNIMDWQWAIWDYLRVNMHTRGEEKERYEFICDAYFTLDPVCHYFGILEKCCRADTRGCYDQESLNDMTRFILQDFKHKGVF